MQKIIKCEYVTYCCVYYMYRETCDTEIRLHKSVLTLGGDNLVLMFSREGQSHRNV